MWGRRRGLAGRRAGSPSCPEAGGMARGPVSAGLLGRLQSAKVLPRLRVAETVSRGAVGTGSDPTFLPSARGRLRRVGCGRRGAATCRRLRAQHRLPAPGPGSPSRRDHSARAAEDGPQGALCEGRAGWQMPWGRAWAARPALWPVSRSWRSRPGRRGCFRVRGVEAPLSFAVLPPAEPLRVPLIPESPAQPRPRAGGDRQPRTQTLPEPQGRFSERGVSVWGHPASHLPVA